MKPKPDAASAPSPALRWLANRVLGLFYRRIRVVGRERIPRDRPLVIVGNHTNGVLDAALLLGYLDVGPRFLAKSTLWKIGLLRPLLRLAAAIPVYRRQDPGVDTSKNEETFSRCHEVLASKGTIALFPEGTSHNEPALVPLKTGVSRIVLQAEDRFGGLGTQIVPVGFTFEDKGRFQSRVLLRVGEPVDPSAERELYAEDERQAVRRLTERVRAALEDVTLNYESWEEARLVSRAAEIYARSRRDGSGEMELAESFELEKLFRAGYRELRDELPEEVHETARAVEEYDRQLELYDLDDQQVAARYRPAAVIRFALRSLVLILLRLPLGILGTAFNYLPYRAAGEVADRYSPSHDVDSTYKVLASLVFFPLGWLAWGWGAAAWVGSSREELALGPPWLWGLGVFLLAAFTGYVALRLHQRRDHFLRQARAFLLLHTGWRGVDELRRRRERVREKVEALVERWREGRD